MQSHKHGPVPIPTRHGAYSRPRPAPELRPIVPESRATAHGAAAWTIVVISSPDRYRVAIDRARQAAYNRLSSRATSMGNRECAGRTSPKQIGHHFKRRVGGQPRTPEFEPEAKRIGRYWALAQYFDPGGSARIVRGLLLPRTLAVDSYPEVNVPLRQAPLARAIVKVSDPARCRRATLTGAGRSAIPSPVPGFVARRMGAPSRRPPRVGNSEAAR